ncbi:hypothetical protein REPUB_Repub07fG0196100 [Reevesia pubescens]
MTRDVDVGGVFLFPLTLNSMRQETTLLISTTQFELCAETGDDGIEELDVPKMKPASKTTIEGLEKVGLGKVGLHCSVCLEELLMEAEDRRLPCSHITHESCRLHYRVVEE